MHEPITAPLAVVRGAAGYRGLIEAFIKRREQLGLATINVDEIAKIADGLTGKLLTHNYVKVLGPVTLGAIMQSLAVKLILVEDAEAKAWLMQRKDFEIRDKKRVRDRRKQANGSKHSRRWLISRKTSAQLNSLRSLKIDGKTRLKIARIAAKARALKLSPKERRRIARKAACDRWHRAPRR